jgi:hypothetical protein
MALPNRMSLRPGLLWLTLNLAPIIQCLSWNNIYYFLNFTYPLRRLSLPQVEYQCCSGSNLHDSLSSTIMSIGYTVKPRVITGWSWHENRLHATQEFPLGRSGIAVCLFVLDSHKLNDHCRIIKGRVPHLHLFLVSRSLSAAILSVNIW